jgi:hypothetical protein
MGAMLGVILADGSCGCCGGRDLSSSGCTRCMRVRTFCGCGALIRCGCGREFDHSCSMVKLIRPTTIPPEDA